VLAAWFIVCGNCVDLYRYLYTCRKLERPLSCLPNNECLFRSFRNLFWPGDLDEVGNSDSVVLTAGGPGRAVAHAHDLDGFCQCSSWRARVVVG
jgi:hypothetical protein